MSLKIGFDSKRAFHNSRGLGNYSRNLIEGLCNYYPENEYYLYTPQTDIKNNRLWNVNKLKTKVTVDSPSFNRLKGLRTPIWRSFLDTRQHQLDIYHGLSHEIPIARRDRKSKYVTTIHDLIFLRFPGNFSRLDRTIYLSKIHHSCQFSDKVIAISNQTKSDLINFLHVPEEKIEVLYQCCSPDYYQKCTDQQLKVVKEKYKLPSEYILYFGAYEKHKNLERLVKAYKLISKKTDLPLVMVGKGGSYRTEIIDLIAKQRLKNKTQLIEYVDQTDVAGVFQMARMLAWPSLYEGFGLPLIEALFSKTPVITTQTGSLPEAAGPGALYVNPESIEEIANGMLKLSQDDSFAQKLIVDGSKYVQQFHQKNTSKNLLQFYKSIV